MVVFGFVNGLTVAGFLANCQFDSQLAKRDLRVVIKYTEELKATQRSKRRSAFQRACHYNVG